MRLRFRFDLRVEDGRVALDRVLDRLRQLHRGDHDADDHGHDGHGHDLDADQMGVVSQLRDDEGDFAAHERPPGEGCLVVARAGESATDHLPDDQAQCADHEQPEGLEGEEQLEVDLHRHRGDEDRHEDVLHPLEQVLDPVLFSVELAEVHRRQEDAPGVGSHIDREPPRVGDPGEEHARAQGELEPHGLAPVQARHPVRHGGSQDGSREQGAAEEDDHLDDDQENGGDAHGARTHAIDRAQVGESDDVVDRRDGDDELGGAGREDPLLLEEDGRHPERGGREDGCDEHSRHRRQLREDERKCQVDDHPRNDHADQGDE